MESKKKGSIFLKILAVLFILYLSLTIAISSGYYEAKLSEKTTITDEAMKQFEEDVKAGKNVDIKYSMSNSLGFGGHNATLIFKKWR